MLKGACASGDPHSARAGFQALEAGGNAVDAAVAAGLMASFTLPPMTGLGAGGLMTIRTGDKVEVLDFFANVPGRGLDGEEWPAPDEIDVPFEDVTEHFLVGAPTVAVPGVVAGLWEAHRRYGRLPLAEVAAPAIEAARDGLEVTDAQYRSFALLQDIFKRTPDSWALIGGEDGIRHVGARMRNEDLARTLELLVAEGTRAFYEGEVADTIVEATNGLVTRPDLEFYEAAWRTPLHARYRDAEVYMPGMPSMSGGMLVVALAELSKGDALPPHWTTRDTWRIADALRRAEALRTEDYETRLFEAGWLESFVAESQAGCTMHAATIDGEGCAVAYTSSLGEGAGLVAPGLGFALNNMLGEPDIAPQGHRRTAGSRMLTSMCPTLVRREDGRWFSLGSAGSDRIRSAILQVLVHVLDGGAGLQEAISWPRVHTRRDTLYVEGYGRTRDEVNALRAYGLRTEATWAPGFFFGGAQAVGEAGDGTFETGADSVRRGCAAFP